ncbi:MAG: protein mobD [Polyangiaceae bacterium]|jgi:hypothetical protein
MDEAITVSKGRTRVYWIGGSKGGVGKSMMTLAILDHLIEKGQKVVLIDCDTSNPDVAKAYTDIVPTELINLDGGDGWIQLVNVCDLHRDSVVVVNTAARSSVAVKRYGQVLNSALDELGQMVVMWMINRQRDSVELLRDFMDAMTHANVHVVRNGHFGEANQFELYNVSNVRTAVESRGGKSVTLPDLADRVADDLYSQRLPISTAAKTLPIGNRAELGRWRGEVRKMLSEVVP